MLAFLNINVKAGDKSLLQDVSIKMRPGELTGLIGPNGAGKSTLLKAGLGLTEVQTGEFLLDGADIRKFSSAERGRKIAYLPQDSHIEWQMSSEAVVMLGRYPYRERFGRQGMLCEQAVNKALATVDAAHLANQSVHSLSGGERARILLARALAVEAPWMLADEPTAGLDPHHQLLVMDVLKYQAAAGGGVLLVLHDLVMAARFMDRLILLDKGKVVVEGPPELVLTQENLQQVYEVNARRLEIDGRYYDLPWERLN